MLEDAFLEEDIWEYKSKRKPKPAHTNNCSENTPKSVEKPTDGKYQSKRKRRKKGNVDANEKTQDPEMCLGETGSQTSAASSQNSSCGDGIQPSQDQQATPGKRCRTHRNKHTSPKIRPVYDGYCPNCQVPFSSLLGQTPRWHVFECLDSPPVSETECPDGLLCTSTIPSHFKRYTHLLLAQSRASNSPLSSPPPASGGCCSETNSGFLCSLEERWSLHQKQAENVKNVSTPPSPVTQCLKKSRSPTETSTKISSSWTNLQTSQQTPRLPERVNDDTLVGVGLPLAEELSSQNNSERTPLPAPESDFSSYEISYSPLQSDEEMYDLDEKLGDSQQELLFTESSKDGSLEGDTSPTLFQSLHGSSLKDQQESGPDMPRFLAQDRHEEALYKYSTLTGPSQLLFQNNSITLCDGGTYTGDDFVLFPSALAEGLTSSYQAVMAKPGQPKCQSNKRKQVTEESAVCNQLSLPLLNSEVPKAFESQGEGDRSFHPTQGKIRKSSSKNFSGKNSANCTCVCGKALGGIQGSKGTIPNTEKSSMTAAAGSLKMSPSGPKCPATQSSPKVMKQMDIGVYFGLPPKRKEDKLLEGSTVEGLNLHPAVSPKEKRSRRRQQQRKRKAERSLSDSEFDAKNLSETPPSVEFEQSPHQRKRPRKSDSLQAGAHQKRSHHLINGTESETVNLRKDKVFKKSAGGRQQRGNTKIPESPNAGQGRKKTCPFYKKIPGTGITVDAFQYGLVEGCTAYFLTHFHSDHYAGLSKNFTFPVYCSEITGNLLRSKLHMQKQYVHPLPMDTECIVNDIKVVLLDANHCPGAVMILFYLPNGKVLLHTGDFRAHPTMERSLLAGQKVHTLYLDTTYCSPEYSFPSQQEVIQFAINTAFEAVTLNPRLLVVCGTYSIGKEKVFLAIADVLGSKVGMSQEKYKTLQCLNIPELNSLITTDMCNSLVHLLPMMQVNFKALQNHLKKCGGKYDQILAFRPTGWTHSNKLTSIADIIPQTKGNISIYGIPYSEHSSYLEMKRFVQWLKPQKIIPTVNVGTLKSRSTMEKYFKEWKLEAGY
ncbi:DNA cross-link repair 1A protein [Crocuta crocuta]